VTTDGSRSHRESDIPAVIEIAGRSFRFGRFHDPVLPQGTAECAYRTWAENACRGKVADCVLVAGTGAVAGFTTIKFDPIAESTLRAKVATIGLVATSAQERGKGIARSLALAALEWCRQQDCKWIEVGTQMGNIAACRLYESAGYRVVSSTLTYRKLL